MVRCPAYYKNLNYIQSFSEQGYATIQLMQQACMNDEWLRQRVLKLNYLTPPAVRKWYKDMDAWIDEDKSYGYQVNGYDEVTFNKQVLQTILIDFVDDDKYIDYDKTDAVIVTYNSDLNVYQELTTTDDDSQINYDKDGKIVLMEEGKPVPLKDIKDKRITSRDKDLNDKTPTVVRRCQLPYENEAEKKRYTVQTVNEQTAIYDYETTTLNNDNDYVNSAWYVGFDKSKNYYIRPDWINDWRDSEIPSVCRGQTFKASSSGKLESIDLKLDYNGTLESDCGSPLYVQIWNTEQKQVEKTIWNEDDREVQTVKDQDGNTIYEKIAFPQVKTTEGKDMVYEPLAQAEYNPSKMTSFGTVNIQFDKEVELVKGNSYFIALFSPLSEYTHCPRWGGWGRNCFNDEKYPYGHAFFSEDNGRTWIQYGRSDWSVDYRYGMYTPQDYAFRLHIRTRDYIAPQFEDVNDEELFDDADKNHPRYLYLKPILTNPITRFRISVEEQLDPKTAIDYQYSLNGKDWYDIDNGTGGVSFNNPPRLILFRANLWRSLEKGEGGRQLYGHNSPYIYRIELILETNLPTEMYTRTHIWKPEKGDNMLGANLWGRLYAPFVLEPTVDCRAEIIMNTEYTDHFTICGVGDVVDYCEAYDDLNGYVEPLTGKSDSEVAEYLSQNIEILYDLMAKNVYVKPYENKTALYRLSFTPEGANVKIPKKSNDENELQSIPVMDGFYFNNDVAYPIIQCEFQPLGSTSDVTRYSEWIDYTFDYDENVLYFHIDDLDDVRSFMSIPHGDLAVTYQKIFINNLSNTEVGVHKDAETELEEEGLILDYFKEKFVITTEDVQRKKIKLRAEPVDPIREVVLNRDTPNERELFENFNYTVDIKTNELIFENVSDNGTYTSLLNVGDVLEVVYTPNLTASGLAVGFYATRTNKDKQVYIGRSNKEGHVGGCYWEYKA